MLIAVLAKLVKRLFTSILILFHITVLCAQHLLISSSSVFSSSLFSFSTVLNFFFSWFTNDFIVIRLISCPNKFLYIF